MNNKTKAAPFFLGTPKSTVGYRPELLGYPIMEILPNGQEREFCRVFSPMATQEKAKMIVRALRGEFSGDE